MTCSGGFIGSGYTAPVNTPVTIEVVPGTQVNGTVQIEGTGNSTINNQGTIGAGTPAVNFIGAAGFTDAQQQ